MIKAAPEVMQFILAAYAYEIIADPFMSDPEWDEKALRFEPQMQKLVENYAPYTGMWIYNMDTKFLGALYNWCIAQGSFSLDTITQGTLKISESEARKETPPNCS